MKHIVITIALLTGTLAVQAQQSKSGYGFRSDSTESNYQNQDAIGGPQTVGAQLRVDNQKKESYYRFPTRVTNGRRK